MLPIECVVPRRYIGPADSLGRCMLGDWVPYEELVADPSPWVNTFIHPGIFDRLAAMSARPTENTP
jgi:hypothetical protein